MSSSPTFASPDTVSVEQPLALRLSEVSAAYESRAVLTSVSGVVQAGSSLALVGPNGAGKTTLIRTILGLVPVQRGEIEVLGTTPADARPLVAYVPQAEALDPQFPVTAEQVVLMGRYRKLGWFRRPGKADRAIARAALAEVGLADRAKARFGTLSGGQRQRVLLARAVAQEAKLLLLDEPFNGVDSTTTDVVLQTLARLRADGAAVVMSTHDLSIAHLACTDACLLNHEQFAFGPIEHTLTAELLRRTYGGSAVVMAGDTTVLTAD